MKQIILELDDEVAGQLERIAPARSRRRSEFLRRAIMQAIWQIEEAATEDAYHRQPDSGTDAFLDPRVWEPVAARPRKRRKKR